MAKDNLSTLLVGSSEAMRELRKQITQVAHTSATVLVWGESGTGKELVSRGIHELSSRAKHNLVPLNCGAIPKELFESELFGHEKGAFSGAISTRIGRFELADKGTLFLDEVGEMPLDMQVKMLRTLQEKTVERVGSGRSIQVDTRIVAATNRCLETAVETGQFREDLFYRLNVYPIIVPPLRERGEDVLELFAHLADGFAFEGFEPITLHAKAASHLLRRQWPGNVRELSNLVERLSIRYPGEEITEAMLPAERKRRIQPLECLPPMPAQSVSPFHPATPNYGNIWPEAPAEVRSHAGDSATSVEEHAALWGREVPVSESGAGAADVSLSNLAGNGIDLKEHLRKIEVGFIEQALEHHKGNVTLAAERLGLRRTTLIEKIKKHEIRPRA